MRYAGIDETDEAILEALQRDGRISFAALARKVHLTRAAVRDRVRSLIERRIIEGFTAVVNPRRLGRALSVFFEIDVEPNQLKHVATILAQHRDVLTVNQMTGPSTLHVHASLVDNDELRTFLQEMVYSLQGVTMVKTYILLASFKSKQGGVKIM